jgi:hypothetical protein
MGCEGLKQLDAACVELRLLANAHDDVACDGP